MPLGCMLCEDPKCNDGRTCQLLVQSSPMKDRMSRGVGSEAPPFDPVVAADNLAKAKEILADYEAGRPLQVKGDGWLVRFAASLVSYPPGSTIFYPPEADGVAGEKAGITQPSEAREP